MRAKATAAIVGLMALLVLGLVACGSDSVAAVSNDQSATDEIQSVAIVDNAQADEAHTVADTDADGHGHDAHADEAIMDGHDDGDGHADGDHADADMEMGGHHHAMASLDPEAPVSEVIATEFKFENVPTEVEAGKPFTIYLHNEGVLEHDITFEGLEDHGGVHVQPGDEGMGTFVIDEPGEYVYYCTVPGHRDAGMHGTLIVKGPADNVHDADGHVDAVSGA